MHHSTCSAIGGAFYRCNAHYFTSKVNLLSAKPWLFRQVDTMALEWSKVFHYPNAQLVLSLFVAEGTDIAACSCTHAEFEKPKLS